MSAKIIQHPASDGMPSALREALEEQECRVWRLRSLLQCVGEATGGEAGAQIDDPLSAVLGLVDLADAIHQSADPDTFLQRVAEIQATAERQENREERDLLADSDEESQS